MRAAVIGLGVIGSVHLSVLGDLGEEVVAVADTDERKLARAAAKGYRDYLAMLDDAKPDVVHVCTPHYLHAEMIEAALSRGIHVLAEKPLCIARGEIGRILRAEERSGARLGVCFQNRYLPSVAFALEYLGGKADHGFGSVVWKRDAAYYASGDWRGKKATEGGGVLINQAIHTLDLLIRTVGMPQYAAASVSTLKLGGAIEVEDTASVLYSGGAEFELFATNGAARDLPAEVTLTRGGKTVRIRGDRAEADGKTYEFAPLSPARGKDCYGTGHAALIADFYDCLRTGRPFPIDGKEGAKSIECVLAAYESEGKKTPVVRAEGETE